jgi:UDP-glucose 4-epimerase
VGESVAAPLMYYRNNVVNTVGLLEVMKELGVKKLVFSSTCATYGIPPKTPMTEDMPTAPLSPYGRTKLMMEQVFTDCSQAWQLGFAALRYFNACGASSDATIGEDHSPESHLIPIVLQVALGKRKQVSIFGTDYPTPDGTCIRDYIHVEDLADAHLRALLRLEPGKQIICNLGTGTGQTVRQVIDACRRVTGKEIPAVESGRRAGDSPALYANATKAFEVLGWKAKYTNIDDVVRSAWQWHQNHPEGFGQ